MNKVLLAVFNLKNYRARKIIKESYIEDELHDIMTDLETESGYDLDYHFEDYRRRSIQLYIKETITQAKADAQKMLEEALQEQAGRLLIEITARCKETTETLIEEARREVAMYCMQTLLGCSTDCQECEMDNEGNALYCPYKKNVEQLKERYGV